MKSREIGVCRTPPMLGYAIITRLLWTHKVVGGKPASLLAIVHNFRTLWIRNPPWPRHVCR